MHKTIKNLGIILLAWTSAVRAGGLDVHNPTQGRFLDEWFELRMAGGKIGYAHNSTTRDQDRIESKTEFHLKIGRADQPVVMDTQQRVVETVKGEPLGFESQMRFSQMQSLMKGAIADGKITIVTSQYGMDQTQVFDFPRGALLSWGLFREQVARGFRPGTSYEVKTYSPELRLDDAVTAKVAVGDWEQFELRGKPVRGQKVTVTMEGPTGSMEMISWVNQDGLPIRSRVVMPGLGDMEMLSATQAEAMSDFVPPEVFMNTVLKAGRKIDKEKARRITYRIKAKNDGVELQSLPQTAAQEVRRMDDATVEVVVSRTSRTSKDSAAKGEPNNGLAEYLDANLMMNLADEKLVALARNACGSEREPFALADKLRKFVSEHVTSKSLNVGFATASEVARTREGDCSEHGVLLAALGRLCGLPSRVVVGLAYVSQFGGQQDIFGYHLWTQFYIDGQWLDYDAALGESDCSPIRIAFAVSSLKHSGVADLSLPLINKIGSIELEIVNVAE